MNSTRTAANGPNREGTASASASSSTSKAQTTTRHYAGVSRDGIGIMLKAILPDVLPCPNHTRHEWARWDAYIYTLDPDTLFDEFNQRGVSFVKKLSFIDEGLWGFEITDADGYVLAFFQIRDK